MERFMEEFTYFDNHQVRCSENTGDIWAAETHCRIGIWIAISILRAIQYPWKQNELTGGGVHFIFQVDGLFIVYVINNTQSVSHLWIMPPGSEMLARISCLILHTSVYLSQNIICVDKQLFLLRKWVFQS